MTPDCADSRYGLPVSGQRATSAVATSDRSIYPKIAGVPWWAAIVIAVTATAIGFAFDAGSGTKELTFVFAASYVAGCVVAVLAVRQSGVFTAVIQPPLLLFCAVPGAYWLFHGARVTGVKDILINCGYPLIERFPLMVCTSAGVLVIGVIRWYLGTLDRGRPQSEADADGGGSRSGGLGAKLAALLGRGDTEKADEPAAKTTRRVREVREAPRRSRSTGSTRSGSAARRSAPTRSRPTRSTRDDAGENTADRARRRRPVHDIDTDAEPRRRPRPVRDSDLRRQPPREARRDPHTRYGRPATRSTRFDPYEPFEPYDPPPRRRSASDAAVSRAGSTHHPISQVRYRGAATAREAQSSAAESWEYDI
jgi:hypothetical protein